MGIRAKEAGRQERGKMLGCHFLEKEMVV